VCRREEVPVALEASVSLDYSVDDIFCAKERGRTKQRIAYSFGSYSIHHLLASTSLSKFAAHSYHSY